MQNTTHASSFIYSQSATAQSVTNRYGANVRENFKIFKNAGIAIDFHFKDNQNLPVPIINQDIFASISKNNVVYLRKQLTVENYQKGMARLLLRPEDTRIMPPGYYSMTIMVSNNDISFFAFNGVTPRIDYGVEIVDTPDQFAVISSVITEFKLVTQLSNEYMSHNIPASAMFDMSTGIHTLAVEFTNFSGNFKIQASIQAAPQPTDWFDIPELSDVGVSNTIANPVELFAQNDSKGFVFFGNYYWVRFIYERDNGNIDKVTMTI